MPTGPSMRSTYLQPDLIRIDRRHQHHDGARPSTHGTVAPSDHFARGWLQSRVDPERTYRGITPAQRQAARRERLMDAGLELFGTVGYARTSIRAVSAAAPPNTRYL